MNEPVGGSLSITIADNGPGISNSDADRIFRPFERIYDTTTEGLSGTGLGLAHDLAKSIDRKLELSSSADSDLSGAHFILTLPSQADNIVPIAS